MSGAAPWRLLDTGLRRAAENLALDQALLEGHRRGSSPPTLRFLRFLPCVLLGYHQDPDQEVNLRYLHASGIDLQRRLTGGGAIYFDPKHLGWELFVHRGAFGSADPGVISRRLCEALARALSTLGVEARYRPRNDVEVGGRKIAGSGAVCDGSSLLFQGTLLVDLDAEPMERALRVDAAKFVGKPGHGHRDRVVGLGELLGAAPRFEVVRAAIAQSIGRDLGVTFEPCQQLREEERALYVQSLAEIDTRQWVWQHAKPPAAPGLCAASYRCFGATIRVSLRLDAAGQRLTRVWISGDFFVDPARAVLDLEASLRDTAVADMETHVRGYFAERRVRMLHLEPDDFIRAIGRAIEDG